MGKNIIITASLVLYKTNPIELQTIINCVTESSIDKLFVIDNSPTDELKYVIFNYNNEKIEYIYGHGNIGFGRGNNLALKMLLNTKTCFHLILNPDIIFKPDVIDILSKYLIDNPDVGLVLPKVEYPDGRIQRLCKLMPTPLDIFGRRFFSSRWNKKNNERYELHKMGYDRIWNCPILSGCFMFLRVEALRRVGIFDERYFMYFEDFDLIRRIHKIYRTCYYPFVSIIHNHAAEHRHNKFLAKESIKSAIKYFNKWGWFWDKERRNANREAIKGL